MMQLIKEVFGEEALKSTMFLLTFGNKIKFWDKKGTIIDPYWEVCIINNLKCQQFDMNNEHVQETTIVNIGVKDWKEQMEKFNRNLKEIKKLDIPGMPEFRAKVINEAEARLETIKNTNLRAEKWRCYVSGKILKALFGEDEVYEMKEDLKERIWKTTVTI